MCRYKSEGDPKGRSDCDSLREENWRVHEMNQKLHKEIRELRKERRIVAWGVQFPNGDIAPFKNRQMAELQVKNANLRVSLAGGQSNALRLVALSIEPLPPGPEGAT
jgi:hypothetical protein